MKPHSKQIKQLLHQGCTELHLDTGLLSQVRGQLYTIIEAYCRDNTFSADITYPLSDTYCEEVIRTQELVSYHHVGAIKEKVLHPVYVALQLETYIGTPVYVKGQLWGTLNFSSVEKRDQPFSDEAREKVKAMALEVSRLIEEDARE